MLADYDVNYVFILLTFILFYTSYALIFVISNVFNDILFVFATILEVFCAILLIFDVIFVYYELNYELIETTLFYSVVIFYESVYSDYNKSVTLVCNYETLLCIPVILASSITNSATLDVWLELI